MRDSSRFRSRRWALSCAVVLALAGCGSDTGGDSGGGQPSFAKATGLPATTAAAANGSTIAAGAWGVVAGKDYQGKPVTFAIRTTGVRAGKAGDLADVQASSGGVDLATAVPFYVAYDVSVLAGDKQVSPNQELAAVVSATADTGLTNLLVDDDLAKCEPPPDRAALTPGLRYRVHGCAVVAAASGAKPGYLRYDNKAGSQGVLFTIPTG